MKKEIYVVACENPSDDYGPIIIEQYTKNASRQRIEEKAKRFSKYGNMGKCKVMKVVPVETQESLSIEFTQNEIVRFDNKLSDFMCFARGMQATDKDCKFSMLYDTIDSLRELRTMINKKRT
tara:strand:+ start:53 stop:418 length:366 start_codon:yes stop_codon:yes gene_type:complete